MDERILGIDTYIFDEHFKAFKKFVEGNHDIQFYSFASHPYTRENESYKSSVRNDAYEKLSFQNWTTSDIGTGKILSATIDAIELEDNNLVQWHSRWGDENRAHHKLITAQDSTTDTKEVESILFDLYRMQNDEKSFESLLNFIGKKYSLIAYLFFIKDHSKYLPISTKNFDAVFEDFEIDFKTSHKCSWENYNQYIAIIREIMKLLSWEMNSDISLLDAHSFLWIITSQMRSVGKTADISEYISADSSQRRSIRLEQAPKKPEKILQTVVVYKRNQDVVDAVLRRAEGICERCSCEAPFIRKADKTPYLEVHHKKLLADDGEDTIENAVAVCPNCHRELHYGIEKN